MDRAKVLDDGDRKTEQDNRFDASQYAFFGRGGTQDIVLGGLDDDDDEDIENLRDFDEDDEFSTSAARDEAGSFSEIGDVGELTTSFLKLNAEGDSSYLGRDVHDLPADMSWIEHERTQWAQQKPSLQRQPDHSPHQHQHQQHQQQQQEWWNNLPKPHGQSPVAVPYSNSSGSNRQQFPPNPPAVHPMMHYPNVPPQASSWLQAGGGPVRPESPLMPPQVFQRSQGFHGPFPMQQLMQQKLEAEYRAKHGSTPPRVVSPDGAYVLRKNLEGGGGAPLMRSKYMTSEEIDTIIRIQWAATHGSDPYTDDYYHQAMQAKLAGGTPHGRRHFAPSHLRDLPSHARTAAEPHAFLQVDALGRIPYSSIRRPRPLLDVDGANDKPPQQSEVSPQRRLEQEPMLAARIAVEDGLCLLLDVDDIDRMLSVSQLPDGGAQLRRRRHMLLEGLAASLQLVDPLANHHLQQQQQQQQQGGDSNGRMAGGRDDLVFLRLVSLPKGRKLLSRYLRLLSPGTELSRVVLMAIFRHLRFLFGGLHSEPASSRGVVSAAAAAMKVMDLASVSACLAAVVLAAEPPPLRPIGSPSGDGATVVLQAALERATAILSDPGFIQQQQFAAVHHQSTQLWQASFDAFFGLLAKYCDNKYESIMHSLMMASSASSSASITSAAAVAMAREMPMELLRASLPHTNEQQRMRLLEFAQRSIVSGAHSSVGDSPVNAAAAAVRG